MGNDDNKSKSLTFNSPEDVYNFLQKPTVVIAEFLTGILSADMSAYRLSAGKLVQAAIKGKLLSQFGQELKQYREEGKIKEDYFATNKNQASLLELLEFIDSNIPDEEVFKAMKAIFFTSIAKGADEAKEHMGYQLLQVCKKLTSLDVLIIKMCYDISKAEHHQYQEINNFGDWERIVSEKIGFGLPELIGAQDDKLVGMGLLSGREYSDKSGVRKGSEFRLTRLSIKLCEFIEND